MDAVRGAFVACLVGTLWCLSAACAQAEDRVLLFESPRLRPGLCGALRIQLVDTANVRCVRDTFGEELPARIAAAANAVQAERARLGILLERDPKPTQVRMYIVAGRKDEAVIAIERIEDRKEPDVDRSLALKVRDALDVMTRAVLPATAGPQTTQGSSNITKSLLPSVVSPPPVSNVEAPVPSPWAFVLEAGGGALFGNPGTRAAGRLLAGGRYNGARFSTELTFGARFHARLAQESRAGTVDENEWGPELSLRNLWRYRRLQLGAFAELMWLRIDARGSTVSGARGTSSQGIIGSSLGIDLRVRLFASAFVRVAPGLDILSVAQRFALDERVTLDVGRTRVLLPVSFLVALPIGGDV